MSDAPPPTPSATFAGFCEDGTSKKAAIFQTVSFAVEGDPHAVPFQSSSLSPFLPLPASCVSAEGEKEGDKLEPSK